MAPKKKDKKRGDDDYWESHFADDTAAVEAVINGTIEEDADFGGLMSTLGNAAKSKKAKKKGDRPSVSFEEDVVARDEAKEKEKQEAVDHEAVDNDESETIVEIKSSKAKKPGNENAVKEDVETGEIRIKSKKEKEREKKEKEKAKKKAAAEKKKAAKVTEAAEDDELLNAAVTESKPEPVKNEPVPTLTAEGDEDDEDDEDDEGDAATGAASKKKKKKKKKTAAEKAEASKPKRGAPPAALKRLIEERKAAEEEARRKEEEERKRVEEEQRRIEEQERLAAEAKARKKEKEREKREQLKKEGKLLTKKQKEQQQQAQLRLQQMLEAGLKVEGLEKDAKVKKPLYTKKKRKPQPQQDTKAAAIETSETLDDKVDKAAEKLEKLDVKVEAIEESWETEADDVPKKEEPQKDKSDLKESWENTDSDVKDTWDALSEDETPVAKAPSANKVDSSSSKKPSKANGKPTASDTVATSKPGSKSSPNTKVADKSSVVSKASSEVAVKSTASAKEQDSSQEDDDEEEDDDESEEDTDDSSEDGSDSEEESDEDMTTSQKQVAQRKAEAAKRREERHQQALAARSKDDLRSPICCILGHVDTGKTKLLDKIRSTNVQEGEAGGITQQIGATYFPMEAIKTKTAVLNKDGKQEYKVPGLLIIDTPGHESFTNLRSRGSSLCNIAILVVDIMHGLEPQTLESLRLLRDRKTPFVVALNKIDRLFDWDPTPNGAFQESFAKQSSAVKNEFETRLQQTKIAFAEQGLNAELYCDNKNVAKYVSLIPTSAITGEGIPDLLMLLVNLTQQRMSSQLMYLSELEATVLEVKVIEGLGTTIDVVLSNGILREGDRIVLCGLNGPIATNIRALLTPQPLKELRIKGAYVHNKEVKAALGVKITAPDLDKAIAGSRLLVVGPDDDEEDLREEVMSDLESLLSSIDKSGKGVCVQASTLGSLEALLDFLKSCKIPVSGINIGPVHKRDIMRCATMLERAREFAVILCFDVKVDKEAEEMAEDLGIKLFKADIIYHLFDAFTKYNNDMLEAKRRDQAPQAVFPCILRQIAVFNKRDPIIVGVDVEEGQLRVGTPICVVKTNTENGQKQTISLGKVASLEVNHKTIDIVKKGQAPGGVAVKIECPVYETPRLFGRHFDDKDLLYSQMTRGSLDVLKQTFRNDLTKEEWMVAAKLKKILDIP